MSWRIDYGLEMNSARQQKPNRRIWMTVLFLAVFCVLVSVFWPEGRDMLRAFLIPGDPDVTLEAAEVFARELYQGIPLEEAARQFCIAVLNNETAPGY